MNSIKWLLLATAACTLSACSSWLPDDPYEKATAVPRLQIPEGLNEPATDATLTTEIESGELVDGGHRPPAAPSMSKSAEPDAAKPDEKAPKPDGE
jgi:uncharacterized lipoprotein